MNNTDLDDYNEQSRYYKRSNKMKRNKNAKSFHDHSDFKGAFSLKPADGRKEEYKRQRVRVIDIDEDFDD